MKANLTKGITIALAMLLTAGVMACGSKEEAESVVAEETAVAEGTIVTEEAAADHETKATEEESMATELTEEAVEEAEVDGMVIDAAMNSLSIMTTEGEVLLFAYPEDGADVELEDGILLGEVVHVTYTGSNDEGNAVAVKVSAAAVETTLDREAYEFAIIAISFAKFNDLEGLSSLAAYPVYVGMGDVSLTAKSEGDFNSIEREELMGLGALADYNLFEMTETDAGIIIGDGKPNIIFSAGENGYAITGINVE